MNITRLDWDDLRLFLAVARTGTLTGAAPLLKLSQPTAGRRLRHLEETCGCALFQRTASGFLLTDEGEAMLARAERMEEEALGIERQIIGVDRELEGQLRLSCSEWFGRLVLAPRVASFSLAHPMVTVEIVADSRLMDLDRREADLVFRFPQFDNPNVVQRRYVRVCYELFAASSYVDRYGAPTAGDDGTGHRLISMDSQLENLPDAIWLRRRFPQARLVLRSNSRDVQAEACAQGAGMAVLPRTVGETFGLVRLSHDEEAPSRDIWLGYHADLKRLKRLRSLVDHLCGCITPVI